MAEARRRLAPELLTFPARHDMLFRQSKETLMVGAIGTSDGDRAWVGQVIPPRVGSKITSWREHT